MTDLTDLPEVTNAFFDGSELVYVLAGAQQIPSKINIQNLLKFKQETIMLAVTRVGESISAGTKKVSFNMPINFQVNEIRLSADSHTTSSTMTIDINDDGTSVSGAPISLTGTNIFNNTSQSFEINTGSIVTIDCDVAGTAVKGVIVYLIGYKT